MLNLFEELANHHTWAAMAIDRSHPGWNRVSVFDRRRYQESAKAMCDLNHTVASCSGDVLARKLQTWADVAAGYYFWSKQISAADVESVSALAPHFCGDLNAAKKHFALIGVAYWNDLCRSEGFSMEEADFRGLQPLAPSTVEAHILLMSNFELWLAMAYIWYMPVVVVGGLVVKWSLRKLKAQVAWLRMLRRLNQLYAPAFCNYTILYSYTRKVFL